MPLEGQSRTTAATQKDPRPRPVNPSGTHKARLATASAAQEAQSSAVGGIAEILSREGNLSGAKALQGPSVQILHNYNQPLSCLGS